MHRDCRRIAERPAPHLLKQLLAAEGLPRVTEQEHQQVVFARGQRQQVSAEPGFVRAEVDQECAVADPAQRRLARQSAAAGPPSTDRTRRASSRGLNGLVT